MCTLAYMWTSKMTSVSGSFEAISGSSSRSPAPAGSQSSVILLIASKGIAAQGQVMPLRKRRTLGQKAWLGVIGHVIIFPSLDGNDT